MVELQVQLVYLDGVLCKWSIRYRRAGYTGHHLEVY